MEASKISEEKSLDKSHEAAEEKNVKESPASEKTTGKHIYLMDGSGFIFRAFHALPPLTRKDGMPVGAVLGFCNIVLKLLDSYDIDNIAVVFDSAGRNFRHDIFDQYKAHRGETPEDLIPQFPLFREACEAFNLPQIELEGYEADDIIATYTHQAVAQGNDVTIVSSDKDLMQLVGPNVRMLDPIKHKFIGPDDVHEKFGVGPEGVIDVQSLAGDSTDNVPGVPGIGVKTAALLINEFGNLEALLEGAHTIKQNKRRENLLEFADKARLSKKLVTLAKDAPLEMKLRDLALHQADADALHEFLAHQGFHTLIGRLLKRGMIHPLDSTKGNTTKVDESEKSNPNFQVAGSSSGASAAQSDNREKVLSHLRDVPASYHLVQNLDALKKLLDEARHKGLMAFDTETTDLNPAKAHLVGLSFSFEVGQAYYLPLQHKDDEENIYEGQLLLDEVLPLIKEVLENPAMVIVGQNLKYDMRVMLRYGIEIASYEDTMVMSYCSDGTKHGHGLDALVDANFGHEMSKFKDVMEELKSLRSEKELSTKNLDFSYVSLDKACDYAAEDADYTLRLYHLLKLDLHATQSFDVYKTLDLPMVKVLALMEHKGVIADPVKLQDLSHHFATHLEKLAADIYEIVGREFNIGSPKQLGEVLFEDMGIEGGKKSKTGAYSTGADILEKLAGDGHEIAEKVLSWRHYAKLKSTYADALPNEISPDTKRVHTNYALTVTSTGRLSSSDPNLQNIPVRTEDGREIRKAFVAKEGYKLVSFDYSQIELRLLAHMAEMDSLKKAFKDGKDIHAITASDIFDIPLENVDALTRRSAKAINFGIIYGISAFGLARQLGISRGEAKQHIETYFEKYPGIRRFMESEKHKARDQGYVETMMGRKCYINGIQDNNPMRRAFAERQAINAPLQGTSADIIKRAMISLGDILVPYNADSNPTVTVLPTLEISESNVAEPKVERPQMDLFGGSMPEGVQLGMPEKKEVPKAKPIEITAESSCPLVGPYSVNQNLLIGDNVRLLLQVHDELIFEIKEDLINEIAPKIQKHMQSVVHLDVPLIVDWGIGSNWNDAH